MKTFDVTETLFFIASYKDLSKHPMKILKKCTTFRIINNIKYSYYLNASTDFWQFY